ncbi:hypothetical protein M8C21_033596 [Ambrosia artemisiifolia]|uniref:ALOG domain-containing protein n=1 Tax=Ambrosia artemisiifolia TaxID=4212 RepID=A0AAD5BWW6_AMBAR|nr:hypothetical protein M8C21_033596 [Ambrosia artemisiifolia]
MHTNPNEFMTLVQRLTGPSGPSPIGSSSSAFHEDTAVSPAARFATIEKAAKSPDGRKPVSTDDLTTVETGYFPGILSPAPAALPSISANYFSALGNDFFQDMSPALHSNNNNNNRSYNYFQGTSFLPSPTNLLSSHIISPTTSKRKVGNLGVNMKERLTVYLEGENIDDVAHIGSGVMNSSITTTLKVLDLSRTNLQSLPPSISTLSDLTVLILQECSMLMELPPEIGKLKNLMKFDLEGTEIIYLPKEMGKLENLKCLRVSFCSYADEFKDSKGIDNIIPRTIMSKFSKMEELSIFVKPDAKWWEVELVKAVFENLHFLPHLQTLKLYLPTAKALQYFVRLTKGKVPIYSTLRDFRLKIGHSKQLTTSLNTRLVESFEKLEKCLKYENGEGSTDDIKKLMRHAKSLFICRHWTIPNLSILDISSLKYCLLAECNEMHTIVDADEFYGGEINTNDAFTSLEYLAIHSMKNLQSIWKGPIARKSLSNLQVLALHSCPNLTTIFTERMLANLENLTVLIVEDCPKVTSLVSRGSTPGISAYYLNNLRKILLLDLPELVCLSNGLYIAPQLDTLLVFNCLKLEYLSQDELSRDVKEIKGEIEWWAALKSENLAYSRAFVPLKRDGYLMNQLAQDTNSLKEFHKLRGRGEASALSGSTQLSSYETKKQLDWGMFVQYLKYRKPPVPFVECNSEHVIEFLKYQNKFGDTRVHIQSCLLYGQPNPTAACFCPFREAWGTLEAIATRLHDAYEENRLPYMKPFDSKYIQSYLNEVRKSQENALGNTPKMHDFPVLTVEEKSHIGGSPVSSSLKKEASGAGTMNNEQQGFSLPGTVTDTNKLIEALQEMIIGECSSSSRGRITEASTRLSDPTLLAIDIISTWSSTVGWKNHNEIHLTDICQYLVATGNIQSWLYSAAANSEHLSLVRGAIQLAMSQLMDYFRALLKVKIKTREHSLSVNPGSTTSPGSSAHDPSSTHEVQDDDYNVIYTVSPKWIIYLRLIAAWASSKGCIQPFVDIYIHERKTIMQSRTLAFNFKIWSTYEIKNFKWEVLESLIEIWIKSVKLQTSFKCVFYDEKQLCEKIFQCPEIDIEDTCFEVTIQDYQIQVFNIIYALSVGNPPPDKIFILLDLYETLDHFLNETSFFAKRREPFQARVRAQLLKVLSDKIISFLSIFEMVLLYDESSVILVSPVDPLAKYVMSYLYQLCDHKHALRKLPLPNLPSFDEDDLSLYSEELKGQSDLSRHVIWIILMMVSNLEGKAKLCKDGSAGHFFAMKNISYIVHKIEGHQALKEVVGDDYLGKLIAKFDQAKVKYVMLELEKIIEMRDYEAE